MFWKGVSIVGSVLIMLGIGMLLTHKGWFTAQVDDVLAKLVTNVALPCTTINQLLTYYRREDLLASLSSLGMALCAILLLYFCSGFAAKLLRIPKERVGTFRAVFSFGNTIFIGLPISTALFGEQAMPAALMFYLANTVFFWSLGAPGIQVDGEKARAGFSLSVTLCRIFTLPMISFLLAVALILLGARLPEPAMKAAGYVGSMVTPLSLMFIGGMLYRMLRQGIRWQRGYGAFIFSHFMLLPGFILLLMALFGGMPPLWRSAYLVQASMPAQSSCAIIAHTYRADAEYATGGITITTLLSMLTIPLFAALSTVLS